MSRKLILIGLGVLVVFALAAVGYFVTRGSGPAPSAAQSTPGAGQPGAVPEPHIAVIDRAAIMRFSKVGQDISRQVQGYAEQIKTDITTRGSALQRDGQAFSQQSATMTADAREKRAAELQARQAALQTYAQGKEEQIRVAVAPGRTAMEKALEPILKEIVTERGDNLLLDKQAVTFSTTGDIDITAEAIKRLDAKLSSYKVTLDAPAKAQQ